MSEWIRNWILSMTGTSLICAAALRLTPEGRVKSVLRMLCAELNAMGVEATLDEFGYVMGSIPSGRIPAAISRR